MTNNQMYQALVTMSKLSEKGKLGFAIAKNSRVFKEELAEYMSARDEAMRKYGKDNGDGTFKFEPDALNQFLAEMQPLDDIEVNAPVVYVTEDDIVNSTLTNQQMEALLWMVKE